MAEREAEEQRSLQFWAEVRVWQRDQQSTIPLRIDETAQYVPLRETRDAGDTGAGCLLVGQWVWCYNAIGDRVYVETRDRNIQCVRGRVGSYYLCSPPPACTIISVTRQGDKVHTHTHTHTHTHMLDKRNFWIGSRGSGQPRQYYADARRIRIYSCEHSTRWASTRRVFRLGVPGRFQPYWLR